MAAKTGIYCGGTSAWPASGIWEVSDFLTGGNGSAAGLYPEYQVWIQNKTANHTVYLGGASAGANNSYQLDPLSEFQGTIPEGVPFYIIAAFGETPLIRIMVVIP